MLPTANQRKFSYDEDSDDDETSLSSSLDSDSEDEFHQNQDNLMIEEVHHTEEHLIEVK